MNLVKLFILNMIMIYFLKYNIKYSYIILSILILYLLLLNRGIIEGNDMNDAKREFKYMEMANIDRLLKRLSDVFVNIDEDCEGKYSDYGECDKKCGKTYKYKTYRITKKGGIKGAGCILEDGFRQRKRCDTSDNIFPCAIGSPCDTGEDCITEICDPSSKTCSTVEVCSNENLNLCDTKFKCLDLNNLYDYTDKRFIFEGDECKLKDLNNGSGTDPNNGETTPPPSETIPMGELCDWWKVKNLSESTLTYQVCDNINASLVFLDDAAISNRNTKIPGKTLEGGLYCREFGKVYRPEDVDTGMGFISQIDFEGKTAKTSDFNVTELNDSPNQKCTDYYKSGKVQQNGSCTDDHYWPDIHYFDQLSNTSTNSIPIDEICTRCDNGAKYEENTQSCTPCQGAAAGYYNQYTIDDNSSYQQIISGSDNTYDIGKNPECLTLQTETSCDDYPCPDGWIISDTADISEGPESCCTECLPGTHSNGDISCEPCDAGWVQPNSGQTECIQCADNLITAYGQTRCRSCQTVGQVPNNDRTSCVPPTDSR